MDKLSKTLALLLLAARAAWAGAPEPVPAPASSADPLAVEIRADTPYSAGGGDDIARLKGLASGVGWEANPNAQTTGALRDIGIRTIRCINVDRMPGDFDAAGNYVPSGPPARLDAGLKTCAEIGAQPHIVIAQSVPVPLRLTNAEARERLAIMGQTPGKSIYWNGDWARLRAYWKELFRYVLVERGFAGARFEVGNEPDIDGQFPHLLDGDGPMGSRKLYRSYLDIYRNAAQAAREFEEAHPGAHVALGGPAGAWAYTFRFGELNWTLQFLQDCAAEHLQLDFVGIHYYGNISSLHGEYPAPYPSFSEMWDATQQARDKYEPGVPIVLTEWGPSYHTDNQPNALVNAGPLGAAWSADFLNTALEKGAGGALFLVTTDFVQSVPAGSGGAPRNVWGWPSFFVNPTVFGEAWPKPPFHLFTLIGRLAPDRVALRGAAEAGIGGIASLDRNGHRLTALLWNYQGRIPENAPPADLGRDRVVRLAVSGARGLFGAGATVKASQWLVSRDASNAYGEFSQTGQVTARSRLQLVRTEEKPADAPTTDIALPSGAIAFVAWELKP